MIMNHASDSRSGMRDSGNSGGAVAVAAWQLAASHRRGNRIGGYQDSDANTHAVAHADRQPSHSDTCSNFDFHGNSGADFHANSRSHTDRNAGPDKHSDACAHVHANSCANKHRDTDSRTDEHADLNSGSDQYGYFNADADRYTNAHAYRSQARWRLRRWRVVEIGAFPHPQ